MYPLFRFGLVSVRALLSNPVDLKSGSETAFRCMPWDLDIFMEMNNGRILTLYDLGRLDLTIRSGFMKTLFKQKWALVLAGGSVRYRKRIRIFDRVTMRTRVSGYEGRWIYIEQSMWVKGEPASSVLFRAGITSKGKVIPAARVLEAIGIETRSDTLSDWVKSWTRSETHRPWPPMP